MTENEGTSTSECK